MQGFFCIRSLYALRLRDDRKDGFEAVKAREL